MEEVKFFIWTAMAVSWDFEYLEKFEDKEWSKANPKRRPYVRSRLWGYFRSLETAKTAVMENWGLNFDEAGYYNGAIIERVSEGYCNYHLDMDHRFFFRRSEKLNEFMEEMPEPKYYKYIIGLTMG